jgi:hypothetical protein
LFFIKVSFYPADLIRKGIKYLFVSSQYIDKYADK